ncbi:hypothetical protein [Azospirillum himalayense]|uniref:Uncharacterized protein n=1 Tax=Azospirillum himalayense TaxID=654847 RepID=A0ABW0GG38_9PROT
MTEEEARKKWCPLARVSLQDGTSAIAQMTGSAPILFSGNRAVQICDSGTKRDTVIGSHCIGAVCMAWRWSVEHCTPPGSNGIGEPVEAHAVGFCGHFGKPEA